MFEILSRQVLAQGSVIVNEIHAPRVAAKARPGQFVILRANERGERIPLTMADIDPERGSITILYQVVGRTTALLASLDKGQAVMDVLGPLGSPTDIRQVGTVICVGGGTGVAVLHPIARGFRRAGNTVISIIGARSRPLLIMEEKMRAISADLQVCTDDGSYGHHGFVTDLLERTLRTLGSGAALAVCIGPIPMMRACCRVSGDFGVPAYVSLNALMVDGTGMCGCCRVSVDGAIKFACVDGPEFDGHKVDFDALNTRLGAYREAEALSYSRFREMCCRDEAGR
ncbi:MAG: sulfide/dihydroorotate dehydrogenase-like FAD/NAD-binding protein [Desulfovibrio sp.]|jgi:ferredoxin--NADP+ reductase|nr:sulfide/dihydroorotate dehydrogenase-like FAD/NAD-binding protein [Desulfovibrio sp.]